VLESIAAGARISDASIRKARDLVGFHADSVSRAVAAGVKVAMGTDAGVGPHGDNLRELPLMVKVGMAPSAALRAATLEASRLLGVEDDLGTVEEGKLADLIVVAGDPFELDDFKNRIEQVWKAGQRVA
jgi:imidazolonepropionase-like amidohydrolase